MEPIASGFQFPLFDSVPELDDHHYIQSKDCLADHNNPVYATIMKEWKILEKNLPESIYVRVSKTRINHLRALIIGAPDSPYHDGLFFFDISLPHDYPRSPPNVYYHSYGYHLNPNLHSNGKVCLSLINTWEGKGTEKWTINSTILQVLVSIQGLVLNSRPYYNDHIVSTLMSIERLSQMYNQKVFIISCKTMIQVMQNPPKGFENFVLDHFESRSCSILRAMEDYRRINESLSRSFISNFLPGARHYDFGVLKSDLKKGFGRIPGAAAMVRDEEDGFHGVENNGRRVKPESRIKRELRVILVELECYLAFLFIKKGFYWMRSGDPLDLGSMMAIGVEICIVSIFLIFMLQRKWI